MFRGGIGPTEILIIVGVIVLLFGGAKLPELARGSGKALRIFKEEVKELKSDDSKSADAPDSASLKSQTSSDEVDKRSAH